MSDTGRPAAPRRPGAARLGTGLSVGQWLALTIGVLFVMAVIGIGFALAANSRLTAERRFVVDEIAPAQLATVRLETALVDQQTGVRGYLFTGDRRFLEPYRDGRRAEPRAYREFGGQRRGAAAGYADEIAAVRSSTEAWRRGFVRPALRRGQGDPAGTEALLAVDKQRFDVVRRALARLQGALRAARSRARREVASAAQVLRSTLVLVGGLIVTGLLGAGVLLRRIVTAPLLRLGRDARRVADGDFEIPLRVAGGAREIAEVAADVDAMRARIVHELSTVRAGRARVEEQAEDLRRSNAELEQFAYVASHDLQEPLRKIASFCQALQCRYHGQLDERADQYIEFAVDGAKRMQILINDLLAFSRVGRSGRAHAPLDAAELVAEARSSLSQALDEADATLHISELPLVRGDRTLLVSVFQNLIANAVKFRDLDHPLVISIDATLEAGQWQFSCVDNGIGIDPEYAERIFVIFQRLHPKEAYPGTGIGLAMCRKIIEHHGGRIWLDPDRARGTCLRFTLPIAEEAPP